MMIMQGDMTNLRLVEDRGGAAVAPAHLAEIIDAVPLPLAVLGPDLKVVLVNDEFTAIVDLPASGVLARNLPEIIDRRWQARTLPERIAGLLEGDGVLRGLELPPRAEIGEHRTLKAGARRLRQSDAGRALILFKLRDITEDKRRWERLQMFEKAVETTNVGITVTDLAGRILYVNPADARMHGYAVEDLIGADAGVYAPEERRQSRSPVALVDWRREGLNARRDGSTFQVQLVSDIVYNERREPIAIVTACEDITERKRLEAELHAMSLRDELTGLYNRRGFQALATQQLRVADRTGSRLLLMYADLNGMKTINDRLGHAQGDLALVDAAIVLRGTFREADIVSRFGGDEFVVLAIEAGEINPVTIADRLRANLKARCEAANRPFRLSLSFGMTSYDPEQPRSIFDLLAIADRRMYGEKQRNKGNGG